MPVTPLTFVVGCGRSGTTLLRAMLTSHPELAIAHESRFAPWVLQHDQRYLGTGDAACDAFDVERFVDDLLFNRDVPSRVQHWPVTPDELRAGLTAAAPVNAADAVAAAYGIYAGAHGKVRSGDKTPGYVNHVGLLGSALPSAQIVHLIRDGRDVALAWNDVDFGASNPAEAATLWRTKVRKARADGAALGPDRYLEIRYEALVADPEPVVRQVCDFLRLPFDDVLLHHHEAPGAGLAETGGQAHHGTAATAITTGRRDWRSQMADTDVRAFEAVAGDVLADLGYEVVHGTNDSGATRAVAKARFVAGRMAAKWRKRGAKRRRR